MRSLFSVFSSPKSVIPQGLMAQDTLKAMNAPALQEVASPWIISPAPLKDAFIRNYDAFSHLNELHSYVENMQGEAARIAIVSAQNTLASAAIALYLGRALTQSGNRVLSIDFKATSAVKEDTYLPQGLTDLLSHDVALVDTLHSDKKSDLNIIHAGQRRMTLEAMLAHKGLDKALNPLFMSYERVLMDFGNQSNRFLFEKIAQKATLLLIVGEGCERHQHLMETFKGLNLTQTLAVMQDARI